MLSLRKVRRELQITSKLFLQINGVGGANPESHFETEYG